MGVSDAARDPEAVRSGLERWLRGQRDDTPDLRVGPLATPAQGLSSETYFLTVSAGGTTETLVARLPPVGGGLFPDYDLALQARIQDAMARHGIPVAAPIAYVDDLGWVGAPFLVMPRIEGLIPLDNPPFQSEGWLHAATPEQQQVAFCGFLDVLADIHRLPDGGVAARAGGPGLAVELDWWTGYLEWAGQGSVPQELRDSLTWCRNHLPDPEPPPSLLWGDVRLGNVIFGADFLPAAVLDWEMASLAPAEVDLGWFFALRGRRPELPGFLDREAALARYSERLGRPLGDLWWYELFALVRSTAILVRMQRLLLQQGQPDHWLAGFDPIPKRIRSFLAGLAPEA